MRFTIRRSQEISTDILLTVHLKKSVIISNTFQNVKCE
jgi:hypothetical protein